MERTDQDRMMEGLYWHGIPTLFRCEHDPDPANADIGLIGVPHSTGNGTTQRDQHLGPRAVRDISALGRRVHDAFGLDPWEASRIHDLGDVPLPRANDNEACIEAITDFYREVGEAGCRPVSIGGDHSIPVGFSRASPAKGLALPAARKPVCCTSTPALTPITPFRTSSER
ncbi:MAG TPA: arginase family protein [Acidimicrobiales bacterium]|nr:arginase family protein [Acidimicrobiales bacterium]